MKIDTVFINKSGIYKITNTINNEFYIGSAVNLYNRCSSHFSRLIKNKHHSRILQNSFNKNGPNSFRFEIIELCNIENLIYREQFYLDTFKPKYNICKIAGSPLGRKQTEETKRKLSLMRKGQKRSKEANLKCSITHKKRGNKPTKECLNKSKQICSKKVINILTNQQFNSLKEASIYYNIDYKQLSNKLLGKRKNNTNLKYL